MDETTEDRLSKWPCAAAGIQDDTVGEGEGVHNLSLRFLAVFCI